MNGQIQIPTGPPQEGQTSREAFFRNGSSYVLLSDTIHLHPGSLLGFSFRTCHPSGELVRQVGSQSDFELRLSLSPEGSVQLLLESGENRVQGSAGTGLADGAWHTVRVGVAPGTSTICLSVDTDSACEGDQEAHANIISVAAEPITVTRIQAGVSQLLSTLNLHQGAFNPEVRVGAGLVGCIREGPELRFTTGTVETSSGIDWRNCLIPETCQGYNWTLLATVPSVDLCANTVCENGGVCLPLSQFVAEGATKCSCPAGYTGSNCHIPTSSCGQTPCLHNGSCTSSVGGGYICNCDLTGHSGRHCEVELNHCDSSKCQNGGTCLDQPGGFLCACAEGFAGVNCEKISPPRARMITNTNDALSTDPCLTEPSPCHNGGTCIYSDSTRAYSCSCTPYWTGNNCDENTNPCRNVTCGDNAECTVNNNVTQCQCKEGYSGDPLTTCAAIDFCGINPCENGGSCSPSGSSFICSCLPGIKGERCEEDVNECLGNPCQNGGSCVNTLGSYSCDCTTGFSGENCQLDIDECATNNPCNNGQCLNKVGTFECDCNAGWSGLSCDVNVDECLSSPCLNGGTCQDQVNGFACQCLEGYNGTNCQSNINECSSFPCLNGGECVDGNNTYTCKCTPRFMGTNCEAAYDPCTVAPCLNGAACSALTQERGSGNEYSCQCLPGYTGSTCEQDINECEGITCENIKHECFDLVGRYECGCPKGFQGNLCEQDINECASLPCMNNGTCIDEVGDYKCQCLEGWTGVNCSVDINECEINENICNKGICVNNNGSFECYCKPGYSGTFCAHDFDECLSRPCQNSGTCLNEVNKYVCQCVDGFNGIDCENDIDECFGDPCQNGATCVDGIANYTCTCLAGYTGRNCSINIDDCENDPCLHGGHCKDGINMYTCDCNNTGYEGANCSVDIDECEISPCQNNATCVDKVNDYDCTCWQGYEGKDCEEDIQECDNDPCQNGGTCFEKSNTTLYDSSIVSTLPEGKIRDHFSRSFGYNLAGGYLCNCVPGYTGDDCQTDIDECASKPCYNGAICKDGVNEYTCECKPGYEGQRCETDINECALNPCQNSAECIDLVADWNCECTPGFGGKNCSVPLTGCDDVTCLNGGGCVPWLVGETDHRANCTCQPGFDGEVCQISTTFSFKGESYISVQSDRIEGYELSLSFRTTLANGLVAIGWGSSFFRLELKQGKLNIHSSMLNQFEGIFLGENLNDTNWQKVYVAVNGSHLTLGVNDRLQAIHPINPDNINETAFSNTFLGGTPGNQNILAKDSPPFIGCFQDIRVNYGKITEDDIRDNEKVKESNTEKGCSRTDQCEPNPCGNEGTCEDLWREYKCACNRPFLGKSCQYNYTGATFGYENITNSLAVVDIDNPAPFRLGIDLSMFIRTRQLTGQIFYLGNAIDAPVQHKIIGELKNGTLQVEATFGDVTEHFKLYSAQLSNGYRHFIRVTRMKNQMTVKLNESISINQEIASPVPFQAEKLYLGNVPAVLLTTTTSTTTTTTTTVSTTTTTTTVTTTLSTTTITTTSGVDTTASEAATTMPTPEASPTFGSLAENTPTLTVIPEDLSESQTAPIRSRQRRQASTEVGTSTVDPASILIEEQPHTFFKGIIQDVQLSNGQDDTKVVQFFELEFSEEVDMLSSLGSVQLFGEVKKGEVSDNSCRVNPCKNGGSCHVTWNDYRCECTEGYKGNNCEEIEYCHWNNCSAGSVCNSIVGGHECVTNSTFNGVNTTITYNPSLSDSSVRIDSISAKFRTTQNGTILHIVNRNSLSIKFSVVNSRVQMIIPEIGQAKIFNFGKEIADGEWHQAVVYLHGGIIRGEIDGEANDEDFLEDIGQQVSEVDLAFIQDSKIVVGSSFTNESNQNFFRGCLGEVRIGNVLLPFFTESELNSTATNKFIVDDKKNLVKGECILCYEHECQNGGSCGNPSNDFECTCAPGFNGTTCEHNIDECLVNECQNGLCVDQIFNYTCNCQHGWTGFLCDQDKDECAEMPCQNGGECEQTVEPGDYTCNCQHKYKGKNCEELKIKTCSTTPCQNGGTCFNRTEEGADGVMYRCDCMAGYEGINCDAQRDFCVFNKVTCQHGGTCISNFDRFNYECRCQPGYEGNQCQDEINECASNPCKNGGQCNDLLNEYSCNCSGTGYMGPTCQEDIDECRPLSGGAGPCLNNATCSNNKGGYTCGCSGNFCGKNCQRQNICLLQHDLCKNEGQCEESCDEEPFYKCVCTPGWEGMACTAKSSRAEELALIVGPIVGGMAFIALVGLLVFLVMARRKRKGEGHYRPAKQELTSPRLQLDNMLKIPPEERLI